MNNISRKAIDGGEENKERRNEGDLNSGSAFRRSSLVMRSPPQNSALQQKAIECGRAGTIPGTPFGEGSQALVDRDNLGASSGDTMAVKLAQRTPGGVCTPQERLVNVEDNSTSAITVFGNQELLNGATGGSPRQELMRKMRVMEEVAISQCKMTLSGMQRAINRQKNISNEVKVGISKIAELLDVMMNYRRTWKTAEEKMASGLREKAVGRQLADAPSPTAANPKRAANSPAAAGSCKKARAKEPSESIIGTSKTCVVVKENSKGKDEGWQSVPRKGRRRKLRKRSAEPSQPEKGPARPRQPEKGPAKSGKSKEQRPRRIRPDAVIIKPVQGHSYSEVLKGLREKITVDVSNRIISIRKALTGAILLEFGRG